MVFISDDGDSNVRRISPRAFLEDGDSVAISKVQWMVYVDRTLKGTEGLWLLLLGDVFARKAVLANR
jgi:hypothetical protein